MAGVRLADYGSSGGDAAAAQAAADAANAAIAVLASTLGDVSSTADAAYTSAQNAATVAALAATQIDLNATIDDLADPLKPRVYRWISNLVTEADIPGGAGASHDFTLAGAVSLPGEFLPVAVYFQSNAVAVSGNPLTTSLSASVGASPASPFLYMSASGVDLIATYGRITGSTGPQLGGIVKTDLLLTLDTGGGNLAHITDLGVRVIVDYTIPGEGA